MGCDIHAYLEVRYYPYEDQAREKGVWINADKWSVSRDHIMWPEEYSRRFEIKREDRIYIGGRNYCLFAILANVRNYWDLPFISEPKGMPDDVSEEIAAECKYWDSDGHSHSYLNLTEILEFEHWDKKEEGTDFALDEVAKTKKEEKYGEKFIRTEQDIVGYKIYYHTDLKELCSEFYNSTIERMKSQLREHQCPEYEVRPDDVRIVFWFDN